LLAHAFTTRRYLDEVTTPALLRGLAHGGRERADFEVSSPVFIVTGRDEVEMATAAASFRKQIAFYASTPAYRGVLELHGWGDLQPQLRALSITGEWDAMADLIGDDILGDDILGEFAVVAPIDRVAQALAKRCSGVIDRVLPGFPAATPETVISEVLSEVRTSH
jgi:probable F420-dependent oxidoreductase